MKRRVKTKHSGTIIFIYDSITVGKIYMSSNPAKVKNNIARNNLPHDFKGENTHFSKIEDNVIVSYHDHGVYLQLLFVKDSYLHEDIFLIGNNAILDMIVYALKLKNTNKIKDILEL